MKLLILSLVSVFAFIGVIDTKKYDYLNFSSDEFDISWDDITEDLWP